MTWEELARVAAFVAVVLAIYVLALRFLVEKLRRVSPLTRRERVIRRVVLGLAAAGTLCIAYGFLVEPYWLSVTRLSVKARVSRKVRIVHLSDLHCDPAPRLEERLPEVIAAEKPDLIAFTGDSINSEGGLPVLHALLGKLARIAPVFVVRGNWDVGIGPGNRADLFALSGVRELDGDAANVASAVWVAGVAYHNEPAIPRALAAVPPGEPVVLLAHMPDVIVDVRADLVLAGHTHGGQVALPFYGALVTFSRFGKRFESGFHEVGGTPLYVSRGIGMDGGGAPRVRFCARPELVIIDLVPRD